MCMCVCLSSVACMNVSLYICKGVCQVNQGTSRERSPKDAVLAQQRPLAPPREPSATSSPRPFARQVDDGPCVMYVGDGGAGNFVKMVHNGIEYGDMQLISGGWRVGLVDGGRGALLLSGLVGADLKALASKG